MPSKSTKKYERFLLLKGRLTKFYIMGLLYAYFEVDKQIPIKCYFIYYLNETTIYSYLLIFLGFLTFSDFITFLVNSSGLV